MLTLLQPWGKNELVVGEIGMPRIKERGVFTHPMVVCEDFTYPKVACLGAMLSSLYDVPVTILRGRR